MKEKLFKCIVLIIIGILNTITNCLIAQPLEEYVSAYSGENASGYIQPLTDLIFQDLHTGLYRKAAIGDEIYFEIGVTLSTSFPTQSDKTFLATTPEIFEPEMTEIVPTITGNIESVIVDGENGTSYIFPGGLDMEYLPLAFPHAIIGGIWGTELSFRYFAADLGEDLGNLDFIGLGVRHEVSRYFPELPVSVSVGFFGQSLNLKDVLESSNYHLSLQVGQTQKMLGYYLSLGYVGGEMEVTYPDDTEGAPSEVNIQLSPSNPLQAELGANLQVSIFQLHVAGQLIPPISVSTGLGFRFNFQNKQ